MANEAGGKDYLLKVKIAGGTWQTVGGLRAKSRNVSHEGVDGTNHQSNGHKSFIDSAGIHSQEWSGSGIYNREAATHTLIENNCRDGLLTEFQLVDAGTGGRTVEGFFHINSFELSGEYNGAMEYSISLTLSGAPTYS